MAEERLVKKGYTIVSYRVRLYDRHREQLLETKRLYDRVAGHFLHVLYLKKELLSQSDFLLLRALEILCIGTKEMKARGEMPEFPLEQFPKIPLYFRRSAINAAIAMARKRSSNSWNEEDANRHEETNTEFPMTLYQGMYRNFTGQSIELKLYDKNRWSWVCYPFAGRELPEHGRWMSPVLTLAKKQAYLDVPIQFEVNDIRTVKERMEQEEKFCAVSFPDYDVTAVAVILDMEGEEEQSCFFRGGNRKENKRKRVIEQLKVSKESRGTSQDGDNRKLYDKLRRLNQHYAHTISRQILDYCLEQEIKLIVVPNYEEAINFQDKRYLKTDSYRWLGRSIIRNLKYKAFQAGIVVTSVKPYRTTGVCSVCGEKLRRYNEGHIAGVNYYGGKLFVCPNGHKGNVAHNSAVNIGKLFLTYFKKDAGKEQ